MKEIRFGMIGLDTSHVVAFTEILNNKDHKYHVAGGRVVVGFPGGSPDMKSSISRVEGYTNELRDKFGVAIVASPEAVAEQCDAILLESVDGRVHLEQFRKIASYGKPTFIDKPFAASYADAQEIVRLAHQYKVPMFSSSSLRYAAGLTEVLANAVVTDGDVIGVDTFGPTPVEEVMPGFFCYGIHSVEMLYTVMGPGCVKVTTHSNSEYDLAIGVWRDGRIGTVRGNRRGNYRFGVVIHREKGIQFANVSAHPKPFYTGLLEQIMAMVQTGIPPIDVEESLEIIRFIEASNQSAETGLSVVL